jgi:tetratricopeptide (TPR) repeat protein
VLGIWRAAAKNLDGNVDDPRRSIAAWQRVLDLAPHDAAALRALVNHRRTLREPRPLVATLEAELRATPDPSGRTGRAMEIAQLWELQGDRVAALAAWERVLRWDPTEPAALASVARLRTGGEIGAALAAYEVAATVLGDRGDAAGRIALLRRAVELAGDGDKLGRFYGLRRILWLSGRDPQVLAEVERAADEAGAHAELADIYATLAAEARDTETRDGYNRSLARLLETKLNDSVRAFLVLQASWRRPVTDADALAHLARLANATGRHEDHLALVDAGVEAGIDTRRAMQRLRMEICEHRLKDPARAFAECARLLLLDPQDGKALADVRRLAEARGLWRALDALYAELWDRAASTTERIVVAHARAALRAERLDDPVGALDQLSIVYRLDPEQGGVADSLLSAAAAHRAWDRVLPLLEARVRAVGEAASPDALQGLAGLHEQKRHDAARAFELDAEAFVLRPGWKSIEADLNRIATQANVLPLLAETIRTAAARSDDKARKLELLRALTAACESAGDAAGALDAHRRILQLDPSALPSLEVMIDRCRAASEWRDLRDRLQQWTDHAPDGQAAGKISRWLEIARLSRDALADYEAALTSYARVLEADPQNEEAAAGVRSLAEVAENPRFELRRLRIELPRAAAERRVEIQLACARIERQQLDDGDAARETLRALVAETGPDGAGYEPLAAALRERGDWSELVDLVEARADKSEDRAARVVALEEAMHICEEHLDAAPLERKERIYRALLDQRPGDAATRRWLLALYRDAGRYPDLGRLLEQSLAAMDKKRGLDPDDEAERRLFEEELARVLDHALDQRDKAASVLAACAARYPDDSELLLSRARLALRRGDFSGYLELRQQQAKRLPSAQAALVLCHLAEACDETPGQQLRVAGLYREARNLDPQNLFATEALKAIGRRAKNWRQLAALLPEPDEHSLSWAARAARLQTLGDAAAAKTPDKALDYHLRAVAIDPDRYEAWDRIAHARTSGGDLAGALEAQRSSLAAYERGTPPAPARLREHAARIEALAVALRAAGEVTLADRLSLRAHRLVPSFAPSALAVADRQLASGELADAWALYDRVLREKGQPLEPGERVHARYRRGSLARRLGRPGDGIADLRGALRENPLHAGALNALAEALAEDGRVAAAGQHLIQSLLVEHDARRRGNLYARLGRLWEVELANPEEAGVCYDIAISAGATDGEVMVRALQHYRRQGRLERALAVIERILPATEDPHGLAALWTERGAILASSGDDDGASEAYDMALSYDPGHRGAITGLSQVLERRGDWEQLAQIFEARTETGSPDERAEALRALARMASAHLHDAERAERYLAQAVQLAPIREDWEALLGFYGERADRFEGRRAALEGLLALGSPSLPRAIELGKLLFAAGERRWAWCVLSPLMNSTLSEPQLKQIVLELRKEFEKVDNIDALAPDSHAQVRSPLGAPALLEVLAALDGAAPLGRATLEAVGAQAPGKLDERTAVGKTFAHVATQLGLEGTLLTRAQELPEPYAILDGAQRHVVVRAELLQLLSVAETAYLFAYLIEQTRPGVRLLASLSTTDRARLAPALWAACGLAPRTAEIGALADRITGAVPSDMLGAWAERLRTIAGPPVDAGRAVWEGALETAQRVGLLGAGDLRFAARVITRLDESLPKMQSVGRVDDLEEFMVGAPPVRALLRFAATAGFGRLLPGGK